MLAATGNLKKVTSFMSLDSSYKQLNLENSQPDQNGCRSATTQYTSWLLHICILAFRHLSVLDSLLYQCLLTGEGTRVHCRANHWVCWHELELA